MRCDEVRESIDVIGYERVQILEDSTVVEVAGRFGGCHTR